MKALIKLQNHFVVENLDDKVTDEEIIERLKEQITEDGLAEYFNADNLFIARFSDRRPASTVSLNEAEVVNDNACVTGEEDVPEKQAKTTFRAELDNRQLELLDEFVAAARRLNEAGVSLFYNGDANALAVVNRDAMQDESFFSRDDKRIASDPKSESVYDNLSASLEVDINYIDHELDHLFIPNKN